MGGFASILGHAATGFEGARQADLQRQFEDIQNRRAQHISLLGKLAADETVDPELRQWATQSAIEGTQAPLTAKWEPKWKEMPTPKGTPAQSFTPPPSPPMQLGNISLPPAPPQTATLAAQPGHMYMSPAEHTAMLAQRAGGVAGAQAGAEMKSSAFQMDPATGTMRQVPISGTGEQIGTPVENAISPYMLQGRGESNINYIDPTTGQPALGTYNRVTRQVLSQDGHVVPNAVPIIPSMLPTTHEGYTYQTDAAGNTVAVPVTTTTTKQLPGRAGISAPPAPPSASISPEQGKKVGVMKPPQALVINPPAKPGESATAQSIRPGSKVNPGAVTAAGMSSANVPTGTIRTMAQRSQGQLSGIQQLGDEIDRMDKEGKLGPMAGRWNDFMQHKIGTGDADYAYLNDKLELVQSAMMLIHAGGRGSTPILKKFEGLLDAGKMDAPTLKAGLRAITEQMQQYAKEGKILGFEGDPLEGRTAVGPNGHRIKRTGGQWIDAVTGQPIAGK